MVWWAFKSLKGFCIMCFKTHHRCLHYLIALIYIAWWSVSVCVFFFFLPFLLFGVIIFHTFHPVRSLWFIHYRLITKWLKRRTRIRQKKRRCKLSSGSARLNLTTFALFMLLFRGWFTQITKNFPALSCTRWLDIYLWDFYPNSVEVNWILFGYLKHWEITQKQ